VLECKQLAVCLRLLLLVFARLCGICILPTVVLFDLRRGVVALRLRVRRALRVVLDVGKAVRRDVAPIVCVRRCSFRLPCQNPFSRYGRRVRRYGWRHVLKFIR